jgi:hypothetical protein
MWAFLCPFFTVMMAMSVGCMGFLHDPYLTMKTNMDPKNE